MHIGDNPYPTLLSEAETTWLRGLPNFHSWGEALDAFPGHTQRAASVIDEVRNRGALQDPGECWWLSPQERLAAQPSLVALSTWHNHPASAIASRMASSVAVIGDDRWVSLLRETLLAGGLNAVNHTSVVPADIVIVCASVPADAPEAVLSWLPSAAQDRPHLPITAYRGRASVGPLVEPGRTPACGAASCTIATPIISGHRSLANGSSTARISPWRPIRYLPHTVPFTPWPWSETGSTLLNAHHRDG